jgi:hypothetical protein
METSQEVEDSEETKQEDNANKVSGAESSSSMQLQNGVHLLLHRK